MTKRALVATVLIGVVLVSGGCSWLPKPSGLFGTEKVGPPAAPVPPEATPEQIETRRELADWVARVLERVWAEGVEAGSVVVSAAEQAANQLRADLGPPAKALPMPILDKPVPPEIETALEKHDAELGALRARTDEFEKEYDRYRATPVKTSWTLTSGALGWKLATATFAAGGAWLLRMILQYRSTLKQVVEGVGTFIETNKDGIVARELKTDLSDAMDTLAKNMVLEMKKT